VSQANYIPLFVAGALALIFVPMDGRAAPQNWAPQASEKLMKLPGNFLKKAVDYDFAKSGLGAALNETDQKVDLKKGTLADIQAALGTADGDLRIELEHQFLAEKKRYIGLMREQQDLRRRRAATKVKLYESLLRKMTAKTRNATPARATLLANQKAARARLENSIKNIDTRLFSSSIVAESKYAGDYAKNLNAMENLVQAINDHPMNRAPEIGGRPVSQADYLRQLIAENEADVALVDQERAILGYMAKLVSLDALALSEGMTATAELTDAPAEPDRLTSALEFFVTR